MPRPPSDPNLVFTKRELLEAAGGLSSGVFDTLRKAARVKGPGHGGLDWEFSVDDVRALIHRAGSGNFTERGEKAVPGWQALLESRGFKNTVETERGNPHRTTKDRTGGARGGGHR